MYESLTIGQVARSSGVRTDTVRYYERRGLIPRPPRRESGYRDFSRETVKQIRFIKRAQELGFTLDEVAELLLLRKMNGAECTDILELAQQKVSFIEDKIADLQAMCDALKSLMVSCRHSRSVAECPIIESLTGGNPSKR